MSLAGHDAHYLRILWAVATTLPLTVRRRWPGAYRTYDYSKMSDVAQELWSVLPRARSELAPAGLSAMANFLFLPYYPFWSMALLAIDIFVIWALCRQIYDDKLAI